MKKLLIKGLALAAVVSALVLALTPFTAGDDDSLTRRYRAMPDGIQIANTGDSHFRHGLNYEGTGYAGFNFGLGSQTLTYDYNLIDTYIGRFAPGSVLVIGISYYSPWADDENDPQRQAQAMRYLGVLDADHIQFDRRVDYLMNRYAPALTWADRKVLTIFRGSQAGLMDEEEVAQSGLSLAEIGERRAAYHMRHIYEDGVMRPFNEASLENIDKMVALCREKGVSPVLVVTPYTTHYAKWFEKDVYPVFLEKMQEIAQRLNIPYLDYSLDARFSAHEALFKDSDHLNEEGARLFTDQLLSDLRDRNLLAAPKS